MYQINNLINSHIIDHKVSFKMVKLTYVLNLSQSLGSWELVLGFYAFGHFGCTKFER